MKYAICNETFAGWPHARVCEFAAGLGYTGLELAPFTLAPDATRLPAGERDRLRATADRYGLTIVGPALAACQDRGVPPDLARPGGAGADRKLSGGGWHG